MNPGESLVQFGRIRIARSFRYGTGPLLTVALIAAYLP
jgi:hypothetical protein